MTPVSVDEIVAMLRFAAVAFRDVACEQNHDRMKAGAREIAEPAIGTAVAVDAENLRPGGHPVAEFLRERRERAVVDAERAQAVAGEGNRDPARVG